MRHLTNPDGSAKTPHIERQEKPEWTAVSEDARQLIGQSIAGNTRAACASALARLDAALGRDRPPDAGIADYLALLYRDGKSTATIALVVAAIQFRTKIAGTRSPVGEVTRRTLAGIRKDGRERGRGQARAVTYDQVIRMQAVASQPRHEARFGVGFAGADQGVHLPDETVVAPRLGRGVAERLHQPVQSAEGFADGKQPVAFPLHGFLSTRSSSQIRSESERQSRWTLPSLDINQHRWSRPARYQYRLFYRESESARGHIGLYLTQKRADP